MADSTIDSGGVGSVDVSGMPYLSNERNVKTSQALAFGAVNDYPRRRILR